MTIHAAKGLEFPVVVRRRPRPRPGGGEPAAARARRARSACGCPASPAGASTALDYEALREERKRADAAEEDRVLHVAMTRAEERLILSGAVKLDQWPDLQRNGVAPIALAGAGAARRAAVGRRAGRATAGTVRCRVSTPATVGTVAAHGLARARGRRAAARPAAARARPPSRCPPRRRPAVRALSYTALSL